MSRRGRDREARLARIRKEAENARRESDGPGGPSFVVGEADLEKLGIRQYVVDSGEGNKGRTHRWSVLPPHPDDPELIALGLFVHYGVGTDNAQILCPKFMKKSLERLGLEVPEEIKAGRCPICEECARAVDRYRSEIMETYAEDDRKKWHREHIRALEPFNGSYRDPKPNRMLMWIVDETDDDTLDKGAHLVLAARSVYLGLVDQADDPDSGETLDVLDDSDEGYRFSFKRKGRGITGEGKVEYSAYKIRPRKAALDEEWLDAVPRYLDVLVFTEYGGIYELFKGMPEASETDKRDEEPEPRRKRRRRPDPEEDGEDAADEIAEHFDKGRQEPKDEEPEPRRRRRRRPEPDDDDDDDDAPDDDAPSSNAKEIADRIRNRMKRRGGGDD